MPTSCNTCGIINKYHICNIDNKKINPFKTSCPWHDKLFLNKKYRERREILKKIRTHLGLISEPLIGPF